MRLAANPGLVVRLPQRNLRVSNSGRLQASLLAGRVVASATGRRTASRRLRRDRVLARARRLPTGRAGPWGSLQGVHTVPNKKGPPPQKGGVGSSEPRRDRCLLLHHTRAHLSRLVILIATEPPKKYLNGRDPIIQISSYPSRWCTSTGGGPYCIFSARWQRGVVTTLSQVGAS